MATNDHPTNAELTQAIFQSQLNYSSQPRDPISGKYWDLPSFEYRFDSIDDIETASLPEGETTIMTHDSHYIPLEGFRRRHDGGIPFKPFQLWRVKVAQGQVVSKIELTRVFWKLGEYSLHGRMTETLGAYFYAIIGKIARRRCWRGYTYRDAFEELALEYLVRYALKYDHRNERQNPIGYLNIQVTNAFTREVQKQKKHTHYEETAMAQHLGYETNIYSLLW